jgi:hypothetical protein
MKIFAMCMECMKELGRPSFEPFLVPYYDDRIAYVECSQGHRSALVIQAQKFEVLMESGASALADGYTLEAVASFSTALERFFEFCLKVISTHREIEAEVYEEMFKDLARQSERQIGAFLVLFALERGRSYRLNTSVVEFRNRTIHKGVIPTPDEAEKFCSQVYAQVHEVFGELRESLSTAINSVVMSENARIAKGIPTGVPRATVAGFGLFSISSAEQKPNFAEAFEAFKEFQRTLSEAIPNMQALHELVRDAVE